MSPEAKILAKAAGGYAKRTALRLLHLMVVVAISFLTIRMAVMYGNLDTLRVIHQHSLMHEAEVMPEIVIGPATIETDT